MSRRYTSTALLDRHEALVDNLDTAKKPDKAPKKNHRFLKGALPVLAVLAGAGVLVNQLKTDKTSDKPVPTQPSTPNTDTQNTDPTLTTVSAPVTTVEQTPTTIDKGTRLYTAQEVKNSISSCESFRDNVFEGYVSVDLKLPRNLKPFFYGGPDPNDQCNGHDPWFIAVQGRESDKHEIKIPEEAVYVNGFFRVPLPADGAGIPTNATNPAFEEYGALSLDAYLDLEEGTPICFREGLENKFSYSGTSAKDVNLFSGYRESISIEAETSAEVFDRTYGTDRAYISTTDVGMSPYENGMWGIRFVTVEPVAGKCQDLAP